MAVNFIKLPITTLTHSLLTKVRHFSVIYDPANRNLTRYDVNNILPIYLTHDIIKVNYPFYETCHKNAKKTISLLKQK